MRATIRLQLKLFLNYIFFCYLLSLFSEKISSVGDVACNFGGENVNKIDSSADVDKILFFNQELWNHFVFGCNDSHKYEDHLESLVNDIVTNNDLKYVSRINELDYGDSEVIINYELCILINAYLWILI